MKSARHRHYFHQTGEISVRGVDTKPLEKADSVDRSHQVVCIEAANAPHSLRRHLIVNDKVQKDLAALRIDRVHVDFRVFTPDGH